MNTNGILGHHALLRDLGEALARGRLPHALLFEGPPGVGKLTVARHLTRAANCEAVPERRPCGACRTCTSIAGGAHPDVIEITPDAERASGSIAVAQIREVVRAATFHRYGARLRFVIVHPAEAMQDPAANALLKTLEEPPAGTHFALIATQARSLLPTIVSRCQRVRFGPVAEDELVAWLSGRDLAGSEAVSAEAVAAASLGCPGIALSLADGALAERIAARDKLLEVLAGPLAELFEHNQKLTAPGRALYRPKLERLLETLEELLRDATLHATGARAGLVHRDRPDVVARWATALWPDGVARCHRAIADCRLDLDRMVSGRTALDALLTRVREELNLAP